jgi:hypothetical protein
LVQNASLDHYLIRDFKESDGAIMDAHDPEVFKTRLLDEGKKLKSFVMARMSFGKHVKNPLEWTSTVESSWHELQGAIKRFDPEALAALELVLDVYNSGDNQWAQWATRFYEQHSDRVFTVGEVLQSIIDRHGLHFAVSASHSSPSHSSGKHARDLTPAVNMIEDFIAKACGCVANN